MQGNLPVSTPTAHPNLLLDRYLLDLASIAAKKTPSEEEWKRVAGVVPPNAYRLAYERWQQLFPKAESRVLREGTVSGRFVTGLGGQGVFEVNIRLHHTYGVPFIPGSSLKGALHAYLTHRLGKEKEAKELFGTTEAAGFVKVYDAWWVPGSAKTRSGLAVDVISVHHPKYYQGKAAPTDFDQPIPINFLTAQGKFLFVLDAPDKEWAAYLDKLLTVALGAIGVGAKKTSGYGRVKF